MSSFGEYKRCTICSRYDFENTHRCAPIWECQMEGDGDDWSTVHATDSEEAAERFAERYDQDGEYWIISGRHSGDVVVLVRKDEDSEIRRWTIEAEAVPTYRAYEADPPSVTSDDRQEPSK